MRKEGEANPGQKAGGASARLRPSALDRDDPLHFRMEDDVDLEFGHKVN